MKQETVTQTAGSLGFPLSSKEFRRGDRRLDASNYARESTRLHLVLENSGIPLAPITRFTDPESPESVFNLGRFKRVWADSAENGYPYLSASEILLRKPTRTRFVSKYKTEKPEKFFAKEGWILLTCSGTVGQPMIVTRRWSDFFYTHDLIRILPKANETGYIYAYLSSKFAQAFLTRDQYGGTVKHLEPHHLLASISIPVLRDHVRASINAKIMKAFELREQANQIEDEAVLELEQNLEQPEASARTESPLTEDHGSGNPR